MERVIKFRGMRVDGGGWVYGDLRIIDSPIGKFYWICSMDVENKVHPESVGQFTGLIDKAGREIYEGDVMDYGFDRVFSVEFRTGMFTAVFPDGKTNMMIPIQGFEIIGNSFTPITKK